MVSRSFNDWSGDGLTDNWNYEDPWLNINTDDGSCIPIIFGCMDSTACNFNQEATVDDETCFFLLNIIIVKVIVLMMRIMIISAMN